MAGHVAHAGLRKCWAFGNLEQLLYICELLFDSINMPQRTHKQRHYDSRRAFAGGSEGASSNVASFTDSSVEGDVRNKTDENSVEPGKENAVLDSLNNDYENGDYEEVTSKTPTFVVKVLYRQNASWQGIVKWVETGQEVKFRSALELIMLMNEAIDAVRPSWSQNKPETEPEEEK